MRHTVHFSFQYSMSINNIVTISPFNDIRVIDVVCPLGFEANHFLVSSRKGLFFSLFRQVDLKTECQRKIQFDW